MKVNLVVVKFPSESKRYLFNVHDYDAVEVGDAVMTATSKGEQKGIVMAKATVETGSNIANLIDEYNSNRSIKPVTGVIKYFVPDMLRSVNRDGHAIEQD